MRGNGPSGVGPTFNSPGTPHHKHRRASRGTGSRALGVRMEEHETIPAYAADLIQASPYWVGLAVSAGTPDPKEGPNARRPAITHSGVASDRGDLPGMPPGPSSSGTSSLRHLRLLPVGV